MRFETGRSREAELAIRRQANAPGRSEVPSVAAAPTTIGVSSTTVASRLSTAVTSAASRKTPRSSRSGRPRLGPADQAGRGGEQPGPGAHVGDDEDRDQEDDHRQQLPERVLEGLPADQTGGQHGQGRQHRGRCLLPPGQVQDGDHEQDGQRGESHRVRQQAGEDGGQP